MKRTLKIALLLTVIMFGGYNFYQSNAETVETSDVVLANVEALAAGEDAVVSCSASCNDGIGKCWLPYNEFYCVFVSYHFNYCTDKTCRFRI